jgi:hypothetical protein
MIFFQVLSIAKYLSLGYIAVVRKTGGQIASVLPGEMEDNMKQRHACLLIIVLSAVTVGCSARQQEAKYREFFAETARALVSGYRLPDESEYGPLWGLVESHNWKTRDGSGRTKAEFWTSGDFNGDATTDYAYILQRETTGTRALVAFVSKGDSYEIDRLAEGFPWGIWLRTQEPGRYTTAAARGAGPDSPENVLEFEAANQAINFFAPEGGSSSFVWNAATGSFDRFQIGD